MDTKGAAAKEMKTQVASEPVRRSLPCKPSVLRRVLLGLTAPILLAGWAMPGFAESATLISRVAGSRIIIRMAPTTQSSSLAYGYAGDRVEILESTQGEGGFDWYRVRFPLSGSEGWVRGDLIQVSRPQVAKTTIPATNQSPSANVGTGGQPAIVVPASFPGPTQTSSSPATRPASLPGSTQTSSSPVIRPVVGVPGPSQTASRSQPISPANNANPLATHIAALTQSNDTDLNYFMEIALGSEFATSSQRRIRKWAGPIRIKVTGTPTEQDRATLRAVIAELNRLIDKPSSNVSLELSETNPNMEIIFAPEPQFQSYEPSYRPVNMGFFWTQWNNHVITRARILISTTGVTQEERSHLIREELTQSLGLMQDSYADPESIFYQGWTATTRYTRQDEAIIRMLYNPAIKPGMTQSAIWKLARPTGQQNARR
ncbi:MAG: DUF2927 domain-containing protein [Leptolyngbyaceae cyanobacterium bins.59]|nr:DUF2927 domain-containing protein [Leptolyngbyaceae cyanobacterium bins.59]